MLVSLVVKLRKFYASVMGPQGCGKSSFINLAIGQPDCLTSATSKLCTKIIRLSKGSKFLHGEEFRFTDTPGFGNEMIEDIRVFELLVECLAPNPRGDRQEGLNLPRRTTGVLYIHSEEEQFKNRTSRRTIEMLVKVLGTRFLDRVTILIQSQQKPQNDLSGYMPPEDSPLFPLYCNDIKPWTMAYEQDTQSIVNILEPYIDVYPRLSRLAVLDNFAQRDGNNWKHDEIPRHLKEFFQADVGPPVTTESRLQEQEKELGRLRTLLAQKDEEIKELQSTHENELKTVQEKNDAQRDNHDLSLKNLCDTNRDLEDQISKLKSSNESNLNEVKTLKEQLDKLRSEKDSEIKELQERFQTKEEELTRVKAESERRTQESVDKMRAKESEITQLKSKTNGAANKTGNKQGAEIDRLKEEIRRVQAEYGSLRNHMQLQENTEQAEITTALGDINRLVEELGQSLSERIEKHVGNNPSGKDFGPQDLLSLFGQVGRELASQVKQDPYLLFEYAVQATVCGQLYTHLFEPFHPSIADDEKRNPFITEIYAQMVHHEAQSVAGRWRRDAFNSISRNPTFRGQDKPAGERMRRLITEALSTLLEKIVKVPPHEMLKEHEKALAKVITKAEEFNRLLKGGVSILGDFQPIAFPFGESFRPDYMSEVNSKPKKGKQPETILATVELGLIKRYALGGGRQPEVVVLRNALVVMGPQGCGKSSFINLAIGQSDCAISTDSKLRTQTIRFSKIPRWINGNEFRFTDTPGLGNEIIDDRRILELLVEYLAPKPRGDSQGGPNLSRIRMITGLLYIHSEDEPFKNRTSRKTIEMLVKILGERFLDRVTVLLRSQPPFQNNLLGYMPPEDSPLYPLYCNNIKPWTVAFQYDPQCVEHILWRYTGLHPRLVRLAAMDNFVQYDGGTSNWRYDNIPHHLREFFPEDIGPPGVVNQRDVHLWLREQANELERLRTLLAQKDDDIIALRSTHDAELKSIERARAEENFNHETGFKRLFNMVQDQAVEISQLKSSKDLELERLETSKKEETNKLDSEIKALREQLQAKEEQLIESQTAKNEEISKLNTEKDSRIEALQAELQAKDEELMKLQVDIKSRESMNIVRAKDRVVETKTEVNGTIMKTEQQQDEIDRLNTEIDRISTEYASLRTHMQLQENTEQADITQALGDINRLIEEVGQSISEHIETHMERHPEKGFQPQDLLNLFGQTGSEPTLKAKQDAYVLLEYAVQATVCGQLYTHLFVPFHPSIADDEKSNMFIMEVYGQMLCQEAQSVAGRWRKDAFNSISRNPAFGSQDKPDDERVHRHITGALSTLLGKIVETPPHDIIKEHDKALSKLINKAEQLNRLLKGEVSLLGDFQPITFPFGEAFQPDYMTEISSKPKKPTRPDTILATIGLGLIKSHASGGNQRPEEIVLRKAVVFGLPK
ncbi:hypothetical protein FRC11_005473 [Ceratobasidium sp. 423]|nr:hypothetical protein FRC11_005473 [Ceratobasidium sp. 423]